MSATNENDRKQRVLRGREIITDRKLENLDDFLNYFREKSDQEELTLKELQSVRSALPEVVLTALSREPWKYWEIVYGYPFQGPNPNQH